MEFKDYLTISISVLALVLSVIAAIVSGRQARREAQRGTRMQLTDVLSRIATTSIERARVDHDESAKNDQGYYDAMTDALDGQQDFLLQQAKYLIDQIPALVTSVELTQIANTFSERGDVVSAELYHKQAIASASSGHYALIARGNYGDFLFSQQNWAEGRRVFDQAVSSVSGTTDLDHSDKGWAYQKWGWDELNVVKSQSSAAPLFETAEKEYNAITDQWWKKNALGNLARAKGSPSQAAPAPSGLSIPAASPPG